VGFNSSAEESDSVFGVQCSAISSFLIDVHIAEEKLLHDFTTLIGLAFEIPFTCLFMLSTRLEGFRRRTLDS